MLTWFGYKMLLGEDAVKFKVINPKGSCYLSAVCVT